MLVHVPPGGRPADPEPGSELVERLALAQVGEHEQGFLLGVQLPPPRPDRLQVPADDPCRVVTAAVVRDRRVIGAGHGG